MFGVPATITVIWFIYVLAAGQLGRALDYWPSSLTMVFGSFLAGSSPEGGGAVAFPVFTKVLHISAPVARTFSLCIQAVGMTVASIIIVLARRRVEWRAVAIGAVAGSTGFVAAVLLFGQSESPWMASSLPGPYVKVTFTLILAAMSYLMFQSVRATDHGSEQMDVWNGRVWFGLALASLIGGGISSLTGTGVNVLLFLFIVVMAGLNPKVGVPSSIITMAIISVVGLVTLGIFDGQLDVVVEGNQVVAVGGVAMPGELDMPAARFDLFGLWLAAVPIVVWGAPLGTFVASRFAEKHLVGFVGMLAAIEVVTTFVLLDDLRSNRALLAYAIGGLVLLPIIVNQARAHRHAILALPV